MFELRPDYTDDRKRHLCIVKGNNLAPEYKSKSYELEFNQEVGFIRTGVRKDFAALARPKFPKPVLSRQTDKEEALRLHAEGKSVRQIAEELQAKGYKVSKSTVGEWIKSECPSDKAA